MGPSAVGRRREPRTRSNAGCIDGPHGGGAGGDHAAAATDSLLFVLYGVIPAVPAIIAYNILVYRVFRGKATELSYGQR